MAGISQYPKTDYFVTYMIIITYDFGMQFVIIISEFEKEEKKQGS
jgi:hypothetical protein